VVVVVAALVAGVAFAQVVEGAGADAMLPVVEGAEAAAIGKHRLAHNLGRARRKDLGWEPLANAWV
jgi:hypothetical protein